MAFGPLSLSKSIRFSKQHLECLSHDVASQTVECWPAPSCLTIVKREPRICPGLIERWWLVENADTEREGFVPLSHFRNREKEFMTNMARAGRKEGQALGVCHNRVDAR